MNVISIRRSIVALAAVAALSAGSSAWAITTQHVVFTGKITSNPVEAPLDSTFAKDQTIVGSFDYDPSTAALAGSTSEQAVFNALTNFEFTIGGIYSASSSAPAEIQQDDFLSGGLEILDRFGLTSRASEGLSGPDVNGFSLTGAAFAFFDSTHTAISDATSLLPNLDPSAFDSSVFLMSFSEGTDSRTILVLGKLDLQSPSAVPEPLTASLGAISLAGVALALVRRRTA